jgi:hypothetical protein
MLRRDGRAVDDGCGGKDALFRNTQSVDRSATALQSIARLFAQKARKCAPICVNIALALTIQEILFK